MLAHLVAALLTQAADPQVAVVVTQRSGLTADRAEALATKVSDVLSSGGVAVSTGPKASAAALMSAGSKNATECQGKRPCLSGLGRLLRVWGVVAVELADLDGTLAVHVELIDSDKAERHAEVDVVMPAKKADAELPLQVIPLIPKVRDVLMAAKRAPVPQPAAVAAPERVPERVPEPAPPAAVTAPEEPARGSAAPMVIAFGGGAVAAAASVAFLMLATQARGELALAGFDVTRSQAHGIAARANTNYTFALGFAIGAGALLLLGAILGIAR